MWSFATAFFLQYRWDFNRNCLFPDSSPTGVYVFCVNCSRNRQYIPSLNRINSNTNTETNLISFILSKYMYLLISFFLRQRWFNVAIQIIRHTEQEINKLFDLTSCHCLFVWIKIPTLVLFVYSTNTEFLINLHRNTNSKWKEPKIWNSLNNHELTEQIDSHIKLVTMLIKTHKKDENFWLKWQRETNSLTISGGVQFLTKVIKQFMMLQLFFSHSSSSSVLCLVLSFLWYVA